MGPREVATACTVGGGVAEFRPSSLTPVAVKFTDGVAVDSMIRGVAEAGSGDFVCVRAEVQAAMRTASRLRVVKRRLFILFLGKLIT